MVEQFPAYDPQRDFYTNSVVEMFPGLNGTQISAVQELYLIPFFGKKLNDTLRIAQLSGGMTNKVFSVHAKEAGTAHIVKFYSRRENGLTESYAMDLLNEQGFPEVPTLHRGSEVLGVHDYIDGVQKPMSDFTAKNRSDLVDFLIRLHNIKPDKRSTKINFQDTSLRSAAQVYDNAEEKLYLLRRNEHKLPTEVVNTIHTWNLYDMLETFHKVAKLHPYHAEKILGSTVCHGDICAGNIIFDKDDNLKVVDFERTGWGNPMVELADITANNRNEGFVGLHAASGWIVREYLQRAPIPMDVRVTFIPIRIERHIEWIARSLTSLLPSNMAEHAKAIKDFEQGAFIDLMLCRVKDHIEYLEKITSAEWVHYVLSGQEPTQGEKPE